MAFRITAPSPRVGTNKTPAPTIPSARTTQYMDQGNKTSMIPQEEMNILGKIDTDSTVSMEEPRQAKNKTLTMPS